MPRYDVWQRTPGPVETSRGVRRLGFWVNHPDREEARRIAASLSELPADEIGLVPA